MRNVALYSRSERARGPGRPNAPGREGARATSPIAADGAEGPVAAPARDGRWHGLLVRHRRSLLSSPGGLVALGARAACTRALTPTPAPLTQQDIDAAVLHTLENVQCRRPRRRPTRPCNARSCACAAGRTASARTATRPRASARGVVIVDKGIILTNLHVVAGADRVQVAFVDGLESEATVIGIGRSTISPCCRRRRFPTISPRPRCARRPTSRSATRSSPSAFRSASGRRCRRASSPGCGASTARRRASACSPISSSSTPRPIPAIPAARWSPPTARSWASSRPSSIRRSSACSSASASPCPIENAAAAVGISPF